MKIKRFIPVFILAVIFGLTSVGLKKNDSSESGAYLEVTLDIKAENREKAAGVYLKYKQPFLDQINGAVSKELLIRTEDVQVLHGFKNENQANAYLSSALFEKDVVRELKPYMESNPSISVYSVFK